MGGNSTLYILSSLNVLISHLKKKKIKNLWVKNFETINIKILITNKPKKTAKLHLTFYSETKTKRTTDFSFPKFLNNSVVVEEKSYSQVII